MKISLSVFEDCVFEYINREIVSKLSDWRKWAIPVAAGMAKPAMDNYFKKYEEILKTANIVDSSNMIDVEYLSSFGRIDILWCRCYHLSISAC